MSSPVCKNCHAEISGKFCSACGQSAETHPVNFHYLLHDIQHGLFHFDKGFFYTLKELFIRPGHTIRDFIDGKRVNHFKPIAFIVVLSTLYGLLNHFLKINALPEFKISGDESIDGWDVKSANEWIAGHFLWIELFTLPFYALSSFIAFLRQGRNYTEHLVLNAFLLGQRLALRTLFFPLVYFYYNTEKIKIISSVNILVSILLIIWSYSQFFNRLSKPGSIFRSMLSIVIFYSLFTLTLAGGAYVVAYCFSRFG